MVKLKKRIEVMKRSGDLLCESDTYGTAMLAPNEHKRVIGSH